MIRMRCIADDATPIDGDAIEAAVKLPHEAFAAGRAGEFETLSGPLRRGGPERVRPLLLVVAAGMGRGRGAAVLRHTPDGRVLCLDHVARAEGRAPCGRLRAHRRRSGARGRTC